MIAYEISAGLSVSNVEDAANVAKGHALAVAFYNCPATGDCGSMILHCPQGVEASRESIFGGHYAAHYVLVAGDDKEDASTLKSSAKLNPWAGRRVFRDNLTLWAEHFPRPAADNPELVAFYASPAHRKVGRLTKIKAGRYLRRVFGALLGDQEVEQLAHVWASEFAPRELFITQDADIIEEVYVNGPNSCMSKASRYFDGECHPARVYAGPDLAVAYIGESDDAEGRAVVWPEKKIWARVYGDEARMIAALELAGFRKGYCDDFEGARLQRIEGDEGIVMPYLDVVGSVDDAGDYMVISSSGDYGAQETNGLVEGSGYRCEDCGDRMNEYDRYYVEDHGDVCECCYSNNYFYCEETDCTYPVSERANTRCGTYISEEGARRSGRWFYCEGEEEWVSERDDDYVILSDGRCVSMRWADGNTFRCEASDEWHEIEHTTHRDENGKVVARVKNWVELDNGEAVDRFYFRSAFELAEWMHENGVLADYSTDDRDELNALLALWDEQDDAENEEQAVAA